MIPQRVTASRVFAPAAAENSMVMAVERVAGSHTGRAIPFRAPATAGIETSCGPHR